MTLRVRKAEASDVNELLRLWEERVIVYLKAELRMKSFPNYREQWRESLQSWMHDERACVLVADREGQIIGYIIGWLWDSPPMFDPRRIGLVSEMSVDGHCKQGGVGRDMLNALKEWFKANAVDTVEVRVPRQQPIEQAFWRAMGATSYIDHMYLKLG